MNQNSSYDVELHANLDPTKGDGWLIQQDSGHESQNLITSV